MARYTLIQSGDFNAAENIGALAGDIKREGIVSGLGISTFDSSVPEIDVAAGKTAHIIDSQTAEATIDNGTTITEQRDQVRLICHVDAQTVGLTDAAVNELYLTPQPDIDDSPAVVATTSGDPTADALQIGEVDTTNNTVSERWNLITDDGTLSYPDSDAATSELQSLPTGVAVIDRTNGVRISNGKISVPSLEAETIIDGDGVSHSGELADISDGFSLADIAREEGLFIATKVDALSEVVQRTNGSASINMLPGAVRLNVDPSPASANIRDRLDFPSVTATWAKNHTFRTSFFKDGASSEPTVTVGMGEWSATKADGFAFERRNGDLFGRTTGADVKLITGVSNEVQLRAEFIAGSKVEYFVNGTKEGELTTGLPTGTTEANTLFSFFVEGGPNFSSKTFISEFRGVQHP